MNFTPPRAAEFPFQLLDADYVRDVRSHSPQRGSAPAISFLYTVSGTGQIRQDCDPLQLPPQSCCLVQAGACSDCGSLSPDEPWSYYYVRFTGIGVQLYAPYLLDRLCCLYPGKPKRLMEILRILQKGDSLSPLLACSRNSLLITELLDMLLESRYKPAPAGQPEDPDILAPAYEYIRKNYASPLTVEDLARECCLSKYYFLRQFKNACGESPYQYLTRHRIDAAKLLLADTELPVNAISAKVGYAHYGNFLVHFKKLEDMTPAEYRRSKQ